MNFNLTQLQSQKKISKKFIHCKIVNIPHGWQWQMWKLHKYSVENLAFDFFLNLNLQWKKHQQATQILGLGEIFLLNFPSGLTVVDFQTPQKPNKFAQLDFKVPVYAMHAQIHKSFVIFYFSPSLHFIMTDDYFPHVKPLIEWNVRCSQTRFHPQMFAFHKSNMRGMNSI